MRITYVGGDFGGGNITNINAAADPVTWPATQPGDLALLFWNFQSTVVATDPSGFVFATNQLSTTGSLDSRLYSRVCDGTETSTISLANSVANKQTACLAIYRGTHKSKPMISGDWTVIPDPGLSTATTHAAPAGTLPVADCAVITMIGERTSTGSSSYTAPAGFTKRLDTGTTTTGGGMTICALADDGLATDRKSGTSVSPGNWSSTFANNQTVIWTVCIRPREYEGWGVDL